MSKIDCYVLIPGTPLTLISVANVAVSQWITENLVFGWL